MFSDGDTIAAIATPRGPGGIAVIRLSGSMAVAAVARLFHGGVDLNEAATRKSYLGKLYDNRPAAKAGKKQLLDQVLVVVFRSPHSYTGEDVVEISCHGGPYVTEKILAAILRGRVRLAHPGEFTQRAFLNGKLDLSQAEAVADIIRAKTAASLSNAMAQFHGVLAERVYRIRTDLIDLCSLLELELDFADEDVEFAKKSEVIQRVEGVGSEIAAFLATYERGKVLRDGAKLVIAGAPNVGKSSLLNALLKEDRAIVTEIAGTTRDVLEEQLDIRGVLFRVIDTAGVRKTDNRIERIGVERTYQQIGAADVVLLLFDGSRQLMRKDKAVIASVLSRGPAGGGRFVAVINKCDLERCLSVQDVKEATGIIEVVELSALRHEGLAELEIALLRRVELETHSNGDFMVSSLRQKNALESAHRSMLRCCESLQNNLSGEFVAIDLRAAIASLGEIIGEVTTEDILDNIFSKFCLGK